MKRAARWLVVVVVAVIVLLTLALGWLFLLIGDCDYRFVYERSAPNGRYAAELYGVDCGMGSYFEVVMLRDRSAIEWPRLDGRPAGVIVTENFDTMDRDSEIFWDGETTLVLQHGGVRGPDLELVDWDGVRIETRRAKGLP